MGCPLIKIYQFNFLFRCCEVEFYEFTKWHSISRTSHPPFKRKLNSNSNEKKKCWPFFCFHLLRCCEFAVRVLRKVFNKARKRSSKQTNVVADEKQKSFSELREFRVQPLKIHFDPISTTILIQIDL